MFVHCWRNLGITEIKNKQYKDFAYFIIMQDIAWGNFPCVRVSSLYLLLLKMLEYILFAIEKYIPKVLLFDF